MAHPNELVVRRFLEGALAGDSELVAELTSEDMTWHFGGRSPISKTYMGRDAFFDFVASYDRIRTETGTDESLELHDIVANDDHVVVLWTRTAERGGDRFSSPGVGVYHVSGGRVAEVWVFHQDQHGFDRFYS